MIIMNKVDIGSILCSSMVRTPGKELTNKEYIIYSCFIFQMWLPMLKDENANIYAS